MQPRSEKVNIRGDVKTKITVNMEKKVTFAQCLVVKFREMSLFRTIISLKVYTIEYIPFYSANTALRILNSNV